MARQWNKTEKLEILKFAEINGINQAVEKYDVARSTIHRWHTDAQANLDNLEWGRESQSTTSIKRKISSSKFKTNDVTKMSRSELEEIAKLHLALKKYGAKTTKDKFFAIKQLSTEYSVDFLSRKLGVTRQGYYLWMKNGMPKYKNYDSSLANTILELFNKFKGVYGYPMITIFLEKYKNIKISKCRVYRYMKILKIKAIRKKSKPNYFKSGPLRFPNILNRNFIASEPNKKWVTDVTYIPISNGMLYLSIVRDLFNGEIIDWKLSNYADASLSFSNLTSAWNYAGKPKNVIIHSDQGSAYTSFQWKGLCENMGFIISMSRRGNSPDNGACESWFNSFKNECLILYKRRNLNFNNVFDIISNYIDFYNFIRPRTKQRKTPFEERMEFQNKNVSFSCQF
ncbi:IS3 family transposase [Spiroplasma sp. DGKH1]|uniref:IS3 family transposase n=1 Tax=Spiroplasma sp. DGKH1 TaxID=3050074 RepID=UPI0034C5B9BE